MKRMLAAALATCIACHASPLLAQPRDKTEPRDISMQHESLSARQQAIVPIAAFTAAGDMAGLDDALQRGLDEGLTVNEIKELLVQMYAYAGFPRSLNALSQFMTVLDQRRARGIDDPEGTPPGPLPGADRLHEVGAANQAQLVGARVKGPVFDFAPQVDGYLKEHLFGAIFARDNIGWQERELATLGGIAMLPGADSQLASHMRISRHIGLTEDQLRQVASVLRERVAPEAADRAESARQGTAAP